MKKVFFAVVMTMLITQAVRAQQFVEGIITDSSGAALAGATIIVKGSNQFSIAGDDGRFRINVKKLPLTFGVSAAGYQFREVTVQEISGKPLSVILSAGDNLTEVVISSRRRLETVQNVPIPISVVGGGQVDAAGAFNVNRVKELVPTVQLYSSNPRNTTLNIRGLGSSFGLTNDGIDPGVGFYVDGVYFARPAATTLDFIDIEQIEVLRGPQGTLFGKNTTAGAFNITTRKPSFRPGTNVEVSYGNYGFVQAKASVTGPLTKKLAARFSFAGTQRDGTLYNTVTQKHLNDLNNIGGKVQFLYSPNDHIKINLSGDATQQRPDGYAQVFAGVVQTQRADYRQFENIIADLNYQLPSRNPFDRLVDHNTTWRSGNDLGGISLNADFKVGFGTLTSTTAWRYWNWDPSNDRDFTGLAVLQLSQAPSKHKQWSQEFRYAGDISSSLGGVIGLFALGQDLKTSPVHTEESGAHQWRFAKNSTSELWETPGLFDGFGIQTRSRLQTFSGAVFANLDWAITERLHVLPGIRFNYDRKEVDFNRQTYGGLQTDDPDLIALKRAVYTDQSFAADVKNNDWSGQLTVSYKASDQVNIYATSSTNFKPVGINLGGLPTASGQVLIELAQIKPEYVTHFEAGVKTSPWKGSTLNLTVYNTNVKDFQAQVQSAEPGINRGYLANAEKVRVQGVEVDANIRAGKHLTFYAAAAYTDGKYISFSNAPLPLEETGSQVSFKDVSKGRLPGISKWAGSLGGELTSGARNIWGQNGKLFLAFDTYYRSGFSSSPTPSRYLNVEGYALLNARAGFRATEGISFFLWARNLLDKDYFEQLLPAAGNAGHYAAVLGDPRTFGVTLRYTWKQP